jgi:hypothetical protein
MTNVEPPIPIMNELKLPGGTYTATQTFVQVDKAGQWFATSMSAYGIISKKFAIHLWFRPSMDKPWQLLQAHEDAHGNITVIGNELYFIVNRMNKSAFMQKVAQWKGERS